MISSGQSLALSATLLTVPPSQKKICIIETAYELINMFLTESLTGEANLNHNAQIGWLLAIRAKTAPMSPNPMTYLFLKQYQVLGLERGKLVEIQDVKKYERFVCKYNEIMEWIHKKKGAKGRHLPVFSSIED
jgi:hypothetical protein